MSGDVEPKWHAPGELPVQSGLYWTVGYDGKAVPFRIHRNEHYSDGWSCDDEAGDQSRRTCWFYGPWTPVLPERT